MTLEAWAKPQATSGRRTILAKLGRGSHVYAVHSATRSGGAAGEARVGGRSRQTGVPDDLPLGRWTHVALTYDGTALRLYRNGDEVSSASAGGRVQTSPGPLRIGGNVKGGGWFKGVIDEVRIYGRALSEAEIKKDMGRGVRVTPPTPPVPVSSTPAPGPSGAPAPAGDLPGWRQVFIDDFPTDVPEGGWTGCDHRNGRCLGLPPSVRDKWFTYPEGFKDTSKAGSYLPAQVNSIQNSMLRLRLRNEGGVIKVGAPIPLIGGRVNSQTYGRYAVRFKIDPVPGFKVAWLLWPDSENWPHDGEIDFPEGDLDGGINAFMHRQGASSGSDQDAYLANATFASGWHTTVIEWGPDACRFIFDGKVIGTSTSRIPSTPMHWVLASETALGSARPASGAVANVYIDWVAIWSRTGG
jgi:hypothetical protein